MATTFRRFRNGLIYFTVGLMIIYMGQQTLTPSLKQEWITLAGLVLATVGFLMAMLAHIRMVISRIVRFFRK